MFFGSAYINVFRTFFIIGNLSFRSAYLNVFRIFFIIGLLFFKSADLLVVVPSNLFIVAGVRFCQSVKRQAAGSNFPDLKWDQGLVGVDGLLFFNFFGTV